MDNPSFWVELLRVQVVRKWEHVLGHVFPIEHMFTVGTLVFVDAFVGGAGEERRERFVVSHAMAAQFPKMLLAEKIIASCHRAPSPVDVT